MIYPVLVVDLPSKMALLFLNIFFTEINTRACSWTNFRSTFSILIEVPQPLPRALKIVEHATFFQGCGTNPHQLDIFMRLFELMCESSHCDGGWSVFVAWFSLFSWRLLVNIIQNWPFYVSIMVHLMRLCWAIAKICGIHREQMFLAAK